MYNPLLKQAARAMYTGEAEVLEILRETHTPDEIETLELVEIMYWLDRSGRFDAPIWDFDFYSMA